MSDITIISQPDPSGSGSGDITGPITPPTTTPNLVDVDSLNLVPLSTDEPSLNDILVYDGAVYVPRQMIMSLISDVDLAGVDDKHILVYNTTTSKWEAKTIDSVVNDNLQFDSIITPNTGDILSYNGTSWVPVDRNTIIGAFALTNLSDVTISSAIDKQILSYDNSTSQWINKTLSISSINDIDLSTPPSQGNYLVYNSTKAKWESRALNLANIDKIDYSSINSDSILRFNSTTDVFEATSISSFRSEILNNLKVSNLTDVDLTSNSDKKILSYNGGSAKWEPVELDLLDLKSINPSGNLQNRDILIYNTSNSSWDTRTLTPREVFLYNTSDLAKGKVLVYDNVTSSWKPEFITLESIVDRSVNVSALDDNTSITWDKINSKWVFKRLTLKDLLDSSGISTESLIVYNNTNDVYEFRSITDITSGNSSLDDLTDVTVSGTPSQGQVLSYNAVSSQWEPKDLTLGSLSNVSTPGLITGHILSYNAVSSQWEPKVLNFTELLDPTLNINNFNEGDGIFWDNTTDKWVVRNKSFEEVLGLTGVSNKDVLVFNTASNKWEADSLSNILSLINTLEGLSDTDFQSGNLSSGDLLTYNTSSSKWEKVTPTLNFLSDVSASGISNSEVLAWNSTNSTWEPLNITNLFQTLISNTPIETLSNVVATGLSNNNLLSWNSTSSTWEPKFITPTNLQGITSNPTSSSELLTWNETESKWETKSLTLTEILGISNTGSLQNNTIAYWNSTNSTWEYLPIQNFNAEIANEITLTELKNVNTPDKSNNDLLAWDSALQQWVAKSLSELGISTGGSGDPIQGNDWVTRFENGLNY